MPSSGGEVFYFDPTAVDPSATVLHNATVEENSTITAGSGYVKVVVACDTKRGNVSAQYSTRFPGTQTFGQSDGSVLSTIADAGVSCADNAGLEAWAIARYASRH